jgi:hypothetical protein
VAEGTERTSCGGPPRTTCWCDDCLDWVRSNPDALEIRHYRDRVLAWMAEHPGEHPETGRPLAGPAAYLAERFGDQMTACEVA